MEDTYTVLQVIARSWGAMFMLLVFLGIIVFVFRPGARTIQKDAADIPFRYDDAPAQDGPAHAARVQEARQ